MKKLSTRTLPELRLIAREQGIDADGLTKAQIVEAVEASGGQVITSMNTNPTKKSEPSAKSNENGVLISPQPEHVKSEIVPEPDPAKDASKVAVYSIRNLSWSGVGKLEKGYNFVNKEVAGTWLSHKAVREVSPEEVASHFGV